MMDRLFPQPVTSLLVLLTWVMLGDPRSPGYWLLGLALAWLLPVLTRWSWSEKIRVRSLPRIAIFVGIVTWDVLVSNLQVTWLILTRPQRLHPVLVKVPLTIQDTFGITTLAAAISFTPGTVAVDVSPGRSHLLVHVFHTEDPRGVVRQIIHRYERRLLEIFPC